MDTRRQAAARRPPRCSRGDPGVRALHPRRDHRRRRRRATAAPGSFGSGNGATRLGDGDHRRGLRRRGRGVLAARGCRVRVGRRRAPGRGGVVDGASGDPRPSIEAIRVRAGSVADLRDGDRRRRPQGRARRWAGAVPGHTSCRAQPSGTWPRSTPCCAKCEPEDVNSRRRDRRGRPGWPHAGPDEEIPSARQLGLRPEPHPAARPVRPMPGLRRAPHLPPLVPHGRAVPHVHPACSSGSRATGSASSGTNTVVIFGAHVRAFAGHAT